MTNLVYEYEPLFMKRLVQDSIISLTTFEQAGKVALQRFWRDLFEVFGQPTDTIDNTAGNWRVEPLQLAAGVFEKARGEHG